MSPFNHKSNSHCHYLYTVSKAFNLNQILAAVRLALLWLVSNVQTHWWEKRKASIYILRRGEDEESLESGDDVVTQYSLLIGQQYLAVQYLAKKMWNVEDRKFCDRLVLIFASGKKYSGRV